MMRGRGFTLLEMVVVIAAGGLLTAWTAHTVILSSRASGRVVGTLQSLGLLHDALAWMERDLGAARAVSSYEERGPVATLVLEMPGGGSVAYARKNDKLLRNGDLVLVEVERFGVELLDRHGEPTSEAAEATALLLSLQVTTPEGSSAVTRTLPLKNLTFPYIGFEG
ncbi:MAG: type II secretion system protein [Planctomycetota bacterium]